MSKILLEPVDDRDYEQFVMAFDRLASHSYAYRINDFIQNYRRTLMAQTSKYAVPKLQYDENGRAFVTTYGNISNIFNFHYFGSFCDI